jgi:hypothetical protein
MNDDRYLQGLEIVSLQQHKVEKDECYPGVSNISKWLLRTIYDNLQDAENKRHALVSIGDSLEVISKKGVQSIAARSYTLGLSCR